MPQNVIGGTNNLEGNRIFMQAQLYLIDFSTKNDKENQTR